MPSRLQPIRELFAGTFDAVSNRLSHEDDAVKNGRHYRLTPRISLNV